MKLEVVGEVVEQEDGSAIIQLDVDDEAKMHMIQLGFEVMLMRSLDKEDKMDKQVNIEEAVK